MKPCTEPFWVAGTPWLTVGLALVAPCKGFADMALPLPCRDAATAVFTELDALPDRVEEPVPPLLPPLPPLVPCWA